MGRSAWKLSTLARANSENLHKMEERYYGSRCTVVSAFTNQVIFNPDRIQPDPAKPGDSIPCCIYRCSTGQISDEHSPPLFGYEPWLFVARQSGMLFLHMQQRASLARLRQLTVVSCILRYFTHLLQTMRRSGHTSTGNVPSEPCVNPAGEHEHHTSVSTCATRLRQSLVIYSSKIPRSDFLLIGQVITSCWSVVAGFACFPSPGVSLRHRSTQTPLAAAYSSCTSMASYLFGAPNQSTRHHPMKCFVGLSEFRPSAPTNKLQPCQSQLTNDHDIVLLAHPGPTLVGLRSFVVPLATTFLG